MAVAVATDVKKEERQGQGRGERLILIFSDKSGAAPELSARARGAQTLNYLDSGSNSANPLTKENH
jgi:hypothetical protein